MQFIGFEKNSDLEDKNFGYLFLKFPGIGTLRLPVGHDKNGNLYVNLPSQYVKSKNSGRPWFGFENPFDWERLKKEADTYLKYCSKYYRMEK